MVLVRRDRCGARAACGLLEARAEPSLEVLEGVLCGGCELRSGCVDARGAVECTRVVDDELRVCAQGKQVRPVGARLGLLRHGAQVHGAGDLGEERAGVERACGPPRARACARTLAR